MLRKHELTRKQRDLVAASLLLCGLAVFVPNLKSYFLADDFVLLKWTSWSHPNSLTDLPGFFDPHTFWFYRPMVKLFYWAVQLVFGLRATPFHVESLILHASNGYLVYRLVIRQSGTRWVTALAAGLLFLLNQHHAET